MTENAVKPVIYSFSLAYDLEKNRFVQHRIYVSPDRDYGEEIPNIGPKRDLGVIAFSERKTPQEMDSKELWLPGRKPLSAFRSNVDRVWKDLFSLLREQEHLAMRTPLWSENPTDYCPVCIRGVGYFHKFQAREGSDLVACLPDIDEICSDMLDLRSYSKMFENRRKS
ncbi:Uncharacterised protein [uncultured archaeon]|nr:Uncharacterised protein [uncultured archaeon]